MQLPQLLHSLHGEFFLSFTFVFFLIKNAIYSTELVLENSGVSVAPPVRSRSTTATAMPPKPTITSTRARRSDAKSTVTKEAKTTGNPTNKDESSDEDDEDDSDSDETDDNNKKENSEEEDDESEDDESEDENSGNEDNEDNSTSKFFSCSVVFLISFSVIDVMAETANTNSDVGAHKNDSGKFFFMFRSFFNVFFWL